jgi:hypothetical protein
MDGSMGDQDGAHKDNFAGKVVPYFSDYPTAPDADLGPAIGRYRGALPVYFAPVGRPVPLLDYLAGPEPGVVLPRRFTPPLQPVALTDLPPADADWSVELGHLDGLYQRVDGRRLAAAYDADIAGRRDYHADEALRRDVREGRRLFARRIGAWPWAVYGPNGRPPAKWRLDELAVAAWRRWVNSG